MTQAWIYDLFISAVEADKGWVEGYLISELEKAEISCISESDFNLGVPRINEFERVIQQSRYTLLVISQAYLADDLTRFTDILAQSYGEQVGTWPVIPLTLQEGLQLPPRLKMLKGLKATTSAQWEAALESLCSQFQHPIPQPSPPPVCPYPGMREFREDDEQRFFGRDEEIEDLLGRLHLHPFLTVIGPSGSGKSSLVFAGLIPKLKHSGLFGTSLWCIRSLRPGKSPLANLESESVFGGDVTNLEVRVQQLLSTQPDTRRLLLVVDQFEELFTQAGAEAILFQQALLKLLEIPNVYLILTVRADFYPDLMVSLLWEKIRSHRFEVLPLDRKGLRQAIVRPAEGVEVYIDSALVERLLVDAQGEPGVLPLLQETLVILWEKLERHFLPLTAYELLVLPRPAYGATPTHPCTGLQVAIAYRADAAFTDLETEEKQAIARRIFLRLVQFGEGRADTRRQQPIEALQVMGDDPVLFQNTLNHLVNSRLLTLSGEEKAEKSRKVDIAHEALISGWPTFQQWIRDRRNSEEIRRRSIEKATEWIRLGRGAGGLLDPVELAEAEQWLTSSGAIDLGNDEALSELMAASRVAIQTTLKAEQRRNHIIIGSLSSLLIFGSIAGFSTLDQLKQSEQALKVIVDSSLRIPKATPEIIKFLPRVFEMAKKEQDPERAIAYYRQVVIETEKLRKEKLDLTQKQTVDTLSKSAETSLIALIKGHRLLQLKEQLSNLPPMIGHHKDSSRRSSSDFSDRFQEQFTEGALRTSYQILIMDTGASLSTGTIDNQAQANRIPCLVLEDFKKTWRESTNNKCNLYGIDRGISSVYADNPGCVFGNEDLSSTTLTQILVGYSGGEYFEKRLKDCHVMP